MGLSNELISQFAKITNDNKKVPTESTIYGTTVMLDGRTYVRLDGSDRLTPVETTTVVGEDERVIVTIKNHTATITGNISSPAAQDKTVKELGYKIDEFDTVIADKVKAETAEIESAIITKLDGKYATFDGLDATYASIKSLEAAKGEIGELKADNVEINKKLTARDAEINQLKANSLTVEVADAKYATIDNLEGLNADFNSLESTYADFVEVTTNSFEALEAEIAELDVESLNARYANIDFTNIGKAAMENFYANSGLIQNVVVGDQTITGELVGVTIRGDRIIGGSIVADKLVIKGNDGIYYKLNAEGGATPDQLATEEFKNGLHGSNIITNSITAEKIDVKDLVAFGATIGNFNIGSNSIYSGAKSSVGNTTRGIYMDTDGQLNFGDSNNFLKFYKDQNGAYKLAISADSLTFSSGKNVEDAFNAVTNVTVEYALSTSNTTAPTSGWSTVAPAWVNGKYMWQRTTTTLGNGTSSTSDPTCITGATGATGAQGPKGDTGATGPAGADGAKGDKGDKGDTGAQGPAGADGAKGDKGDTGATGATGPQGPTGATGKGVKSIVAQYYLSTSKTAQSGGSWSTTAPTWSSGKYVWTRSLIIYTDNTTATTTPLCDSSWEAVNEIKVSGRNLLQQSIRALAQGAWNTVTNSTPNGNAIRVCSLAPISLTASASYVVSNASPDYQVTLLYFKSDGTYITETSWITTYPYKFTTPTNAAYMRVSFRKTDNTTLYPQSASSALKFKIEKGTIPTEWTRAPEDEPVKIDCSQGKMLHKDPMFATGTNSCAKYNNTSNSNVTISRIARSSDNPFTASGYQLQIQNIGTASPGCGGYNQTFASRANGVFVYRIVAKIPIGRNIGYASNAVGNGGTNRWLTPQYGTGRFEEYIIEITCGSSGTFSSGGYFYIDGAVGTSSAPVTWYVAYSACFDMSNISDVSTAQNTANTANTTANNALNTANAAQPKRSHAVEGGGNANMYINFATFKITAGYVNYPINFRVVSRGYEASDVQIMFNSTDGTDPTLNYIRANGTVPIYIVKTATSTWNVIMKKNESYGNCVITQFYNPTSITVTWTSTQIASLPSGYVQASGLAESREATNYLKYDATNGLVIGNMTASTLGNNVRIDSDSVDIRNGNTIYASYGANLIELGKNNMNTKINLCNGLASIEHLSDDILESRFYLSSIYDMYLYSSVRIYQEATYDTSTASISMSARDINGNMLNQPFSSIELKAIDADGTNTITLSGSRTYIANISSMYDTCSIEIAAGKVNMTGPTTLTGALTAKSTLAVTGNTTIGGTTTVTGIIYAKNNISLLNNKVLYGKNTAGADRQIAYINDANNLRLGYGGYANSEGRTDLMGNEIRFYVKYANDTNYKPYYDGGDSVSIEWYGAGFISSSGGKVYFSIPLSKPVIGGCSVSVTSVGGITVRQNRQYVYGSTSSAGVALAASKYTAVVDTHGTFIRIIATMPNTTNAINNAPCGIHADIKLTFAYG